MSGSRDEGRRGHVTQQGATWAFVVDVAPPGAPRKQVRRRGFPTRRAAQAALTELLAQRAQGVYVKVDREVRLADYVHDVFLPTLETQGRAPATLASYRQQLDVHVLPVLGAWPLASIGGADLARLWAALLAGGRINRGTVAYVARITGQVFSLAVKQGLLKVSPLPASSPPPTPGRRTGVNLQAWEPAQVRRFLEATAADRLGPLWHLLATTGARRGEALAAQWGDVDLNEGTWTIRRALAPDGRSVIVRPPKTDAGARTVRLDPGTVAVLRQVRRDQTRERLLMGGAFEDQGWVFARPDGSPYHPKSISAIFARTVTRVGAPRLSLHGLRHSWASAAIAAGVDAKTVAERLGHSSVVITLSMYTHPSDATHADAARRVADLFTGSA